MVSLWVRIKDFIECFGEGNGNSLQYSCMEKSHGQRSLEGYSPSGHKELDTTEHADTLASNMGVQRGAGSIPVGGSKSPHASWPKKKIRT